MQRSPRTFGILRLLTFSPPLLVLSPPLLRAQKNHTPSHRPQTGSHRPYLLLARLLGLRLGLRFGLPSLLETRFLKLTLALYGLLAQPLLFLARETFFLGLPLTFGFFRTGAFFFLGLPSALFLALVLLPRPNLKTHKEVYFRGDTFAKVRGAASDAIVYGPAKAPQTYAKVRTTSA